MNRSHRLRIAAILLSIAAFAIAGNAVPPLITTFASSFGIPVGQFGYAFFIQYLAFAVASTVIAMGTKGRHGVAILISSLAVSSTLFLFGPLLRTFPLMLAWFVPFGLAGGFTETQVTILLGREDGEGSSRLVSLSQAFFCAGAIISPQIVSFLLFRGIAWRTIFYLFALLIGLVTLFVAVALLWRGSAAKSVPGEGAGPTHKQPLPVGTRSGDEAAEPQGGKVALLGFSSAMFFYVLAEGSVVAWVAAYFEIRFALAPPVAAQGLSAFWVGVLLGRVVVFLLPAKYGTWRALLGSVTLGTASLAFIAPMSSSGPAFVGVFVSGLLLAPMWPAIVSAGRTILKSDGAVATIVTSGALGVAVGPFLSSRWIVIFGMERLFLFVLSASFVVVVIVYTMWMRYGKERNQERYYR